MMGIFDRFIGKGRKAFRAFDAGKNQRRLRGVESTRAAINAQIRQYGENVLARSRYLASNNPYAAAAKEAFVSALVGDGIKPSSLIQDAAEKEVLQQLWLEWTDEADSDWLTDFYGLQAIVAAEMFEAGECFVRFRPRLPQDGLSVPLQLQVLPAEMLPLSENRSLSGGRRIEMGIEFDAVGRRVAYHFLRQHPGSDQHFNQAAGQTVRVPADDVLHLYKPIRAGQIRGLPHTLSGIVTAAILDCYDDAELERKRTAALFSVFVTRPTPDDAHPLETEDVDHGAPDNAIGLEPAAIVDLGLGEDVKFAEPADVGGNFEAFQYRALLRMAAGFGVPYAAMTGDLRQTSYGSIRAGLVEFRRRVEAMQHHVMVYQLCRPVWRRWLDEAALVGELPVSLPEYQSRVREFRRVKWIPPHWEWIDPLKDLQAEKLAVDEGFKARSDVIEAQGFDPEEVDERIRQDSERASRLGLNFGASEPPEPEEPQPTPPTEEDEAGEDEE